MSVKSAPRPPVSTSRWALFALGCWFILMLAPFWTVRSWDEYRRLVASTPIVYQAVGVAFFVAVSWLRPNRVLNAIKFSDYNFPHLVFIAFCQYTFLQSTFSIDPIGSFVFSVIHIAVYFCLASLWNFNESAKYFPILGAFLFLYCGFLASLLGVNGRFVGWIPANDYAKLAMVAAVFCAFGSRFSILLGAVAAYGIILISQSRGTLLFLTIFYVGLIVFGRGFTKRRMVALVLIVVFGSFAFIADELTGRAVISGVLDNVLLINDPDRGLGSGLTGRSDFFSAALSAWSESPLFGYGLRTRENFLTGVAGPAVNGHSGYLNMLLDVGLVGAVLLMASVLANCLRRLYLLQKTNRNFGSSEEVRVQRVTLALTISGLVLWIIEPVYINVGSPFSILMLLCMAAPLRYRTRSNPV